MSIYWVKCYAIYFEWKSFTRYVCCEYILPVCGISYSIGSIFLRAEVLFCFNWSSIHQFFLSWIMPLMLHLKSQCHTHGHLDFLLCCLLGVLQFCFTFKFMNHFVFIFVKYVRYVSRFLFAHGCPLVPAPFVKKTIFASLYCFCAFSKIRWLHLCGSISELSIPFQWSIYLFF